MDKNIDDTRKSFDSLLQKSMPDAIKSTQNIMYGVVNAVNITAGTVDVMLKITGEIIPTIKYQAGVIPVIGADTIIVTPELSEKTRRFAIIFDTLRNVQGPVIATDVIQRTQATPTGGTWYNLGSVSIIVPPGVWYLEYGAQAFVQNTAAATDLSVSTTLSTANNTQSDVGYTVKWTGRAANIARFVGMWFYKKADSPMILSAPTTLFLNTKTDDTATQILNDNAAAKLFIKATPVT